MSSNHDAAPPPPRTAGDADFRRSSNELMRSQPNLDVGGVTPPGSRHARNVPPSPSSPHRQTTSGYEERLREKLRTADENRSRIGGGGGGGAATMAASTASGSRSDVVGPSDAVSVASSLTSPSLAQPGAVPRPGERSASHRADRFWNKVNRSGAHNGAAAAAVAAYASAGNNAGNTPEEADDELNRTNEVEEESRMLEEEEEEVRAETGLRPNDAHSLADATAGGTGGPGASEVRAEMGLRPGDVASVAASGTAASGATNTVSVLRSIPDDEKAAMNISSPPGRAVSSGEGSVPGAHQYQRQPSEPRATGRDGFGASSYAAGGGGGGGAVQGLTRFDTEAGVLGGINNTGHSHVTNSSVGGIHGTNHSLSSAGGQPQQQQQHMIVMDQNNNPMVVAQAVSAVTSDRDLGGSYNLSNNNINDSFADEGGLHRSDGAVRQDYASSTVTGGGGTSMTASVTPSLNTSAMSRPPHSIALGGPADRGDGNNIGSNPNSNPNSNPPNGPPSSSTGVAVAVASKDTFSAHLLRSRKTQCGLVALVLAVVGLAVGLGVALGGGSGGGGGGGGGGDTGTDTNKAFWQAEPPTVDGTPQEGEFGTSVSLNGDGTRLAVGSPDVLDDGSDGYFRRGLVEVYRLVDDEWEPLGSPIYPGARDSNGDILDPSRMGVRSVIKVVLSDDGDTVAVGSAFHDVVPTSSAGNETGGGEEEGEIKNAGMVEVFRFEDGQWTPLGDPIVGTQEDDYLGASLDLSADGGTLAVGIPGRAKTILDEDGGATIVENAGAARIFLINNKVWTPLGSGGADGTVKDEMMGGSVSLSADGRRFAAGSSATRESENTVVARAFKFAGGEWSEVGDGVEGREETYDTAYTVVLSADGERMVVSNHYVGEAGPAIMSEQANSDLFVAGFDYDQSEEEWVVIGENLHEYSVGDKSGYFITLSNDGNMIGMGDPGRSVTGGRIAGHAHIYVYNPANHQFEQVGPNIDGQAAGDMFGYEVALSGDGRRFAIGAPSSRGNGYEHGRVQVYDVPQ